MDGRSKLVGGGEHELWFCGEHVRCIRPKHAKLWYYRMHSPRTRGCHDTMVISDLILESEVINLRHTSTSGVISIEFQSVSLVVNAFVNVNQQLRKLRTQSHPGLENEWLDDIICAASHAIQEYMKGKQRQTETRWGKARLKEIIGKRLNLLSNRF